MKEQCQKLHVFLGFFPIVLLLHGCCVTVMCREATCVKTNVTGEAVLPISVYRPPVIRTLYMKAMTDVMGVKPPLKWKIEFYFLPTLPCCLPSIPQKSA